MTKIQERCFARNPGNVVGASQTGGRKVVSLVGDPPTQTFTANDLLVVDCFLLNDFDVFIEFGEMASEMEELLDIRDQIAGVLDGIDRYNPSNLPLWEKYVELQASTGEYDFEANLAVLKLYQFNPASFRADITSIILLKALMNLPAVDFNMCKAILPEAFTQDDKVSGAMYLADLLETCYFARFWDDVLTFSDLTKKIAGFEDTVRKYVCQVIGITFQSVPLDQLTQQLGGVSGEAVDALITAQGWLKQADGTVFVGRKEAATTKPKKVVEQLDLDTVLPVLNQQRKR